MRWTRRVHKVDNPWRRPTLRFRNHLDTSVARLSLWPWIQTAPVGISNRSVQASWLEYMVSPTLMVRVRTYGGTWKKVDSEVDQTCVFPTIWFLCATSVFSPASVV